MSAKLVGKDILFVVFLIAVGIMSRLVPHPWNFTAIGTMALFSGISFRSNKFLIVIPFLSLAFSDAVIGFYDGAFYVYAGFALVMGLSFLYFSKLASLSLKARALSLGGLSVVSSFLFFLVTNFGVWFGSTMYAPSSAGLMSAYVMGLPFLFNQIAGDLFYGAVIFWVYEYMKSPTKVVQTNTVS